MTTVENQLRAAPKETGTELAPGAGASPLLSRADLFLSDCLCLHTYTNTHTQTHTQTHTHTHIHTHPHTHTHMHT